MTSNQLHAVISIIVGATFFIAANISLQFYNLKVSIKGPDVSIPVSLWIFLFMAALHFIIAVWYIISQQYDENGKPL